MEKVLRMHETIQLIIENADAKAIVACALVNQVWSNIALNNIWHTIYHPGVLFAISVPEALPFHPRRDIKNKVSLYGKP